MAILFLNRQIIVFDLSSVVFNNNNINNNNNNNNGIHKYILS